MGTPGQDAGSDDAAGPRGSERLPAAADLEGKPRLGPYVLLGELGRGGMGAVSRAYRPGRKREFALKVILLGADASPAAIVRFRREARRTADDEGGPGRGCPAPDARREAPGLR